MGACARNMQSDPAEIKPAQCCIKLVFHLTYTMMHGSTKLKFVCQSTVYCVLRRHHNSALCFIAASKDCLQGSEPYASKETNFAVSASRTELTKHVITSTYNTIRQSVRNFVITIFYFHCYTVHVVELLNYYTNHCTYIKFIKFYKLKH